MKKFQANTDLALWLKLNSRDNYRFEKALMKLPFVCFRGTVINYTNYIIIWLVSLITILLAKSSEQQAFPRHLLHCFLYSSSAPTHIQIINSMGWQQLFSWVFVQYKGISCLFCAFSQDVIIT